MAKKFVYAKGYDGHSDFVYIDLLPDVKRSRQFNVNVIIALTLAIVASFVLIYLPYSSQTVKFEESNGLNNDLRHELLLTQEEYDGYEINLTSLSYQEKIEAVKATKTDFNGLKDDVEIIVDLYDASLTRIQYDAETRMLKVSIQMTSELMYETLNSDFLNLPWATNSIYDTPRALSNGIMFESMYTIGVDEDAE